jgi:two-component system cell cycle response regulator
LFHRLDIGAAGPGLPRAYSRQIAIGRAGRRVVLRLEDRAIQPGGRMRKINNGILIGAVIGIVALAIWAFSPSANLAGETVLGGLATLLMGLVAAGYSLYIAARKSLPLPLRRAWGLLAMGTLCSVLGGLVEIYYSVAIGPVPVPSIADSFYLLAYPFVLAGILMLPYAATRREQRLLLNLDIGIVVLVAAVFLWHFVVANLVQSGELTPGTLISIAYPIGDLLVLTGLVSLIQRDVAGIRRAILYALSGGMLFFILSDTMYAVLENYAVDTSSVLWQIAGLLVLAARWGFLAGALWQAAETQPYGQQTESFSPLLRTNLVYVAVLGGTGLAFAALVNLLHQNLRLYVTIMGSFGITLLVVMRQYLVLLENRRLKAEVELLAVTDGLTSLYNRRYFDGVLARQVSQAQRYGRPLSLLLFDVNDFKLYNDRHGHPQGDQLLQTIGQCLKEKVRASDVAARYGGDEFVVVLPETTLEGARAVVDKLQSALRTDLATGDTISLTIGCAAFQPGLTAEALLALADQDMYRLKKAYHDARHAVPR